MPDFSNLGAEVSTPQVDTASTTVTPDATAAPAVNDTAVTTTPGTVTPPAGQEASLNQVADSAPATPADSFSTNPELRNAYNDVVTRLQAHEPLLNRIEERGGPDFVQQSAEMYDAYVGPTADPEAFQRALYELSPSAYQANVDFLLAANRDYAINRLLGEHAGAFQQYVQSGGQMAQAPSITQTPDGQIDVPDFDEETGEPIPESIRNVMRQQMQRLAEFDRQQRTANETYARQQAEARARQVDESIANYQSDRLKVIGKTVEQIGLNDVAGDSDEVKADKSLLRSVIESAAMRAFGNNERSRNLYQRALTHLENGELKPAQGLSFQIEAMLATEAGKVASRISKLLDAERQLKTQSVQQAANGARPEVSSTGAAVATTTNTNTSHKPFTAESIEARLEQLRAAGKIRR
jgi:hypothetical protein